MTLRKLSIHTCVCVVSVMSTVPDNLWQPVVCQWCGNKWRLTPQKSLHNKRVYIGVRKVAANLGRKLRR